MIAVDRVMVVGTGILPQSDAPFRKVGRTATQNELEKLASGLDRLANRVEKLHEPAIRVLAQQSIMRAMLGNPVQLRQIAANIRHADLSGIPIIVPRGPELAVGGPRDLCKFYPMILETLPDSALLGLFATTKITGAFSISLPRYF